MSKQSGREAAGAADGKAQLAKAREGQVLLGSRSSVLVRLPLALRRELEQRLADESYWSLSELSAWLATKGYQISRTALGRYRRRYRKQLDALMSASEQARVIAECAEGDEGRMTEALSRLVQQRLFDVLVECARPLETPDLARIARTINDLGRATISQRRWLTEMQQRLERQQSEAAAQVGALERTGGLTRATAHAMRNVLLGIDPLAPESGEEAAAG
ncbi:MAG TPA: phage protein Gp27 family protein [Candidatus Binataceae bacterium]|nr:phage protein Gp27 family protein [Candidatus Binataceae bacterium]